jgi:hypothetical protein
MSTKVLTVAVIFTVLGLLALQRFSMPAELPVLISAATIDNHPYGLYQHRGATIQTDDYFLKVSIGNKQEPREALTHLWLSKNTTITLERLYDDELVIRLTRGRIVASTQAQYPLTIKTNATTHLIHKGVASFINYDFLGTVHVVPIEGSVQTTIAETGENLLTPVPFSIHETDPVSYSRLEVNLTAGDSREFYEWTVL